jgi:hypothetical protein
MIIHIKGCSGSGKSTVVNKVMSQYDERVPEYIPGRKQPIGYVLRKAGLKDLFVVGHYETDCGGCDTIKFADETFDIVRQRHAQGFNVLFEGLLLTADAKRTISLHEEGLPLFVVNMNTDLETCLASINERRQNKWKQKCDLILKNNQILKEEGKVTKIKELPPKPEPVNPHHTTEKFKQNKRIKERLDEAGVPNDWLDRQGAFNKIKEAFEL